MSEWTGEVEEILRKKLPGEVIKDIHFEEGMNEYFIIEFESGKELKIEYDWIYKFSYNGEEIDPE